MNIPGSGNNRSKKVERPNQSAEPTGGSRRAQKLGAIGYEIKPVDSTELAAIANNIRLHLPGPA